MDGGGMHEPLMKSSTDDDIADPGIVPGGIRDRALRAIGYVVPPWWYRTTEKLEPNEQPESSFPPQRT
jgi:hypothetical protein